MKTFRLRTTIDNTLSPGKPKMYEVPITKYIPLIEDIVKNINNDTPLASTLPTIEYLKSQSEVLKNNFTKYIGASKFNSIVSKISYNHLSNIKNNTNVNILKSEKGYLLLLRNHKAQTAYHLIKGEDEIYNVNFKVTFSSIRKIQFWEDFEINEEEKSIALIGYDANKGVLIKRNPYYKEETICTSEALTSNNEIEYRIKKHKLEREYNLNNKTTASKFIGGNDTIAAFYDYGKESLIVWDFNNSNVKWEKKDSLNNYENSVVYREMIICIRSNLIQGRELKTGDLIFYKYLDEDSISGPLFIMQGELFVFLNKNIVEINITSNKATQLSREYDLEQELAGNHLKDSVTIFKELSNVEKKINKDAGLELNEIYLSIEDPIPIIKNNRCYFFYSFDAPHYNIIIIDIQKNFLGEKLQWILSRVDGESAIKLIEQLPIKGTLQDSMSDFPFREALSSAIFRLKEYYESVKFKSFTNAYSFMDYDNIIMRYGCFSEEMRNISTGEVYNLIYKCISSSFNYLSLPDFNNLFFFDRTEIIEKVKIDFNHFTPLINESQVSQRALYLLEEVKIKKYFIGENYKRDDELNVKIQNLSEGDKIFIYENILILSKNLTEILARKLSHCTRTYGFPVRSITYEFLAGLHTGKTKFDNIFRAILQIMFYSSEIENKGLKLSRNIEPYTHNDSVLGCIYGEMFGSNFSTAVYINNEIQLIEHAINNNIMHKAIEGYNNFRVLLSDYLSEIENEKLQSDYLDRIHRVIPNLINFLINKGQINDAFDIYENMKSIIFKLYLSDENKKVLLNRIYSEKMYKKLMEVKKSLSIKNNDTRSNGVELLFMNDNSSIDKRTQSHLINNGVQFYGWENLSNIIDKDSVLVEYYISEDKAGVFLGLKNKDISYYELKNIDRAKRIHSRLKHNINKDMPIEQINTYLSELYNILIAPIWEHLEEYETIVVVPSSFLYNTPFTGLYDGKRYLIQKKNIVIEPSSQIFLYGLKNNNRISFDEMDAFFSPKDILPGAEKERIILTDLFQSNLVTKSSFDNIHGDILHISAHGNFNYEEPLLSTISINENETISVIDIYTYDLNSVNLAFVNTCVSGVLDVSESDELIGLVRGLITAGCSSVINTLWELNDNVAPLFTELFYNELKSNNNAVKVFSKAIRKLIINHPDFSHPYYWSCYQIYG